MRKRIYSCPAARGLISKSIIITKDVLILLRLVFCIFEVFRGWTLLVITRESAVSWSQELVDVDRTEVVESVVSSLLEVLNGRIDGSLRTRLDRLLAVVTEGEGRVIHIVQTVILVVTFLCKKAGYIIF